MHRHGLVLQIQGYHWHQRDGHRVREGVGLDARGIAMMRTRVVTLAEVSAKGPGQSTLNNLNLSGLRSAWGYQGATGVPKFRLRPLPVYTRWLGLAARGAIYYGSAAGTRRGEHVASPTARGRACCQWWHRSDNLKPVMHRSRGRLTPRTSYANAWARPWAAEVRTSGSIMMITGTGATT